MKFSRIALLTACVVAPAGMIVVANVSNVQAADLTVSVPIGSASNYSVLGASTVTNTGPTTLARSLGLSPGTAVTGFPPGVVQAAGTIDIANSSAAQAQSDLTAGYINAAGRPLNFTVPADLGGQTLQSGVYATDGKGSLGLTGMLVLDGHNNSDSVFIFQTDSTLTTASGSSIALINGAQACRVYFVVGSSATLGTGSSFVGTILAQASITVTTGTAVRGRALARTGAVTLDSNVFSPPSCLPPQTGNAPGAPGAPGIPPTGSFSGPQLLIATLLVTLGVGAAIVSRRRPVMRS